MEQVARYFSLAVSSILVVAGLVVATIGLDSLRLVETFDTDEASALGLLAHNLRNGNLDPHGVYFYGRLYDSLAYYVLAALAQLGWTIDIPTIGFTLRTLALIGGLLAAVALVCFARLLGVAYPWALMSGLLLFSMPDFVLYQRTMHPDTLQTAFVIAAMAVALAKPTPAYAVAAAAIAGLAFATKYSGLAVLPFCFLPLALVALAQNRTHIRDLARLAATGLAMVAVFAAVYLIANPYAIENRGSVYRALRHHALHSSIGHYKTEPVNPLLWVSALEREFGWPMLVLLAAGVALTAAQLVVSAKRRWRDTLKDDTARAKLILLGYVAFTVGHLALAVRMREIRYAYHVVPFVIALGFLGLSNFLKAPATTAKRRLGQALLLATMASIAVTTVHDLRQMAAATQKPNSPLIAVGQTLAARYPAATRILAEPYVYLPDKFRFVDIVWGIDARAITHYDPDMLVLTRGFTGRFVWKKPGTRFAALDLQRDPSFGAQGQQREAALTALIRSPQWTTTYETADVLVLTRAGKTFGDPQAPLAPIAARLALTGSNFGLARTLERPPSGGLLRVEMLVRTQVPNDFVAQIADGEAVVTSTGTNGTGDWERLNIARRLDDGAGPVSIRLASASKASRPDAIEIASVRVFHDGAESPVGLDDFDAWTAGPLPEGWAVAHGRDRVRLTKPPR